MSVSTFDKPLDHELESTNQAVVNLQDAIGKVVDGNTSALTINKGDYVIVKNSTISGITDGLYKYSSSTSKSAGTAVSSGELTAASGGGLNELNSNMPTLILRALYPVGSIYMSFNNSIPTALSSIGTWTAVTGGYCLKTITTGTGGTLSNAGNTGSTTLTAAQSGLPKHRHTMTSRNGASAGSYFAAPPMSSNAGSAWTANDWCGETGGTSATEGHTHTAGMPSNVAVYMWKRTA